MSSLRLSIDDRKRKSAESQCFRGNLGICEKVNKIVKQITLHVVENTQKHSLTKKNFADIMGQK